MPKFTKGTLPGAHLNGFDAERTSQVVQVGKEALIYLSGGAGVEVKVQNATADQGRTIVTLDEVDPAKLSGHEKAGGLRKFRLTGVDLGAARLTAGPLTVPLQVLVAKGGDSRVFDGGKDVLPPQVVTPMKAYGLRGAALRVAEDQMASTIGRTSGKGVQLYIQGHNKDGSDYDWCGGFAEWCYAVAARMTGETNPFGDSPWALASPERAISWAMAHPGDATVVRYEGSNPMDADGKLYGVKKSRPETQELRDLTIAAHGNPSNVIEGDICLHRNSAGGWKHVCTVYNVTGDTFDTMNGNPKIWIDRGLKFSDKVGKVYRYSFLHLSLPPVDWVSGWAAESGVWPAP